MTTLEEHQLATVSGGIFYGEKKSPTGERWAANVDAGAKWLIDHVPTETGKGIVGVLGIPTLGVSEFAARRAGALWDYATGGRR